MTRFRYDAGDINLSSNLCSSRSTLTGALTVINPAVTDPPDWSNSSSLPLSEI